MMGACISSTVPRLERSSLPITGETVQRIKEPLTMKTIEARVTTNIKEDPSIEECDIWNIQATFLNPLPSDATEIMADPIEIGGKQLEGAKTDRTRTAVT